MCLYDIQSETCLKKRRVISVKELKNFNEILGFSDYIYFFSARSRCTQYPSLVSRISAGDDMEPTEFILSILRRIHLSGTAHSPLDPSFSALLVSLLLNFSALISYRIEKSWAKLYRICLWLIYRASSL